MKTSNLKPIPILTYHQIDECPIKGTPYRGLVVSQKLFSEHMQLIRFFGYKGVSMSELLPYLQGEKNGKVIGITFDDGYKNNFTKALPILKKHNFSATCYIVTNYIGKTNEWDLEKKIKQTQLMTEEEIRSWCAQGFEVGSHTMSHPYLTTLSDTKASAEIKYSRMKLEEIVEMPINHFCYPYGNFSERDTWLVKEANYKTATTTVRGRIHFGDHLHSLNRISITRTTHHLLFLLKLFSRYEINR